MKLALVVEIFLKSQLKYCNMEVSIYAFKSYLFKYQSCTYSSRNPLSALINWSIDLIFLSLSFLADTLDVI